MPFNVATIVIFRFTEQKSTRKWYWKNSTPNVYAMADNYLEKQYADYEKRRAEWERQKKLGKIKIKKS